MRIFRQIIAISLSIALILTTFYPQTVMAGISSDVVGITDDTGSATFDNTIGIGSGLIGDKGAEIAEAGLKNVPGSSWYTRLGTVSKIIKWGGFTIGTLDTAKDTYTFVTDNSKHTTFIGKMTDKGLALVGIGMGWAATIGTVVTIGATAPVTGTAAVVTGTGFAVAAAGVAITRALVNTESVRIIENILSGNRKGVGFAPFETPGFKENRQVVKEMLGFDPYDHSDNEIPDPNTGIPVYKPNIYLYSLKDMEAAVHLYPAARITEAIPEYQENAGWTAQITDGSLNGSEDFLFYEALVPDTSFQKAYGWLIRKEKADADLEAILETYGFSAKEKADFMAFWPSVLDGDQNYIAYPQDTEGVNRVMPIRIEPAPEHLNRLWLYFVPVLEGATAEPPKEVVKMDHSGYSVVEWGGMLGN